MTNPYAINVHIRDIGDIVSGRAIMKKAILFTIPVLIILSIIVLCLVLNVVSARIQIDGNSLYVSNNFRDDNYTVVWECDAGTLYSQNSASEYTAPRKSTYYLYTGLNEKVTWMPEDADGFCYSTATIKIHVYKYNNKNRYHKCQNTVYEDSLTVSIRDGALLQTNDRTFGNPVRDDGNDSWRQIIPLDQQGSYVTLRYRFGKPLASSERVCWETNAISLCVSTFQDAPIYVVGNGFNPDKYIFDSETVCYDFSKFNNYYFDDTDSELYPANIRIKAFVLDDEGNRSSVADVSIEYYYNSSLGKYSLYFHNLI